MFGVDDAIIAAVAPTVINGLMGSSAADKAVSAQTDAANQANATQLRMYNQNRQDLSPWRTTGAAAQNKLAMMLGINPASSSGGDYYSTNPGAFSDTWHKYSDPYGYVDESHPEYQRILDQTISDLQRQGITPTNNAASDPSYGSLLKPFSMSDYQADPGYGFRLSEGLKAIQNSAAARGGLLSGSALKGITRYGQDAASQEYGNAYARYNQNQQNQYARLSGLSSMGENAAGQIAGLGANTAAGIAGNQIGIGNATGAAAIGNANSLSNSIGQGLNFYNQNQLLNGLRKSSYGSGAVGPGGMMSFGGEDF